MPEQDNEFLKRYGLDDKSLDKKVAPPAAQPGKPSTSGLGSKALDVMGDVASALGGTKYTPGRAPTYDEMGWQLRTGQGVAKSLAGTGAGIGTLIGQGDNPLVQRMKAFSDEPSEGIAESAGNVAGTAAQFLVGPGEAKLASYLPRGYRWAKAALGAGENLAKGAAGGAIANPDDPTTGAAYGAAGSLLGPLAGAGLRSPQMRWIAAHLPGTALGYALYRATGHHDLPGSIVASTLGHSVRWYHAPWGRTLRRWGDNFIDETGRIIGSIVTPQDWAKNMAAARARARGLPGTGAVPPRGSYAGVVTPQMGGYAAEKVRQGFTGDEGTPPEPAPLTPPPAEPPGTETAEEPRF